MPLLHLSSMSPVDDKDMSQLLVPADDSQNFKVVLDCRLAFSGEPSKRRLCREYCTRQVSASAVDCCGRDGGVCEVCVCVSAHAFEAGGRRGGGGGTKVDDEAALRGLHIDPSAVQVDL